MTLQAFYDKYNNQPNVGNTPANLGECVGLVSLWMDQFKVPHVYGHAKDLYANTPDEYFAKIPNTPDAIVQDGDIVVWSAGYNGTYGHTGIAKGKADVNSFECFEQNDPLGSKPHIKKYNYAYIIGWLRPRSAIIPQEIAQENIYNNQTLIPLGEYGVMEIQAIKGKLGDLERTEKLLKDAELANTQQAEMLESLKKQLKECQEKPKTSPKTDEPIFSNPLANLFYSIAKALG